METEHQTVTMPSQVRFKYGLRGRNFLGTAEVQSLRTGKVYRFETIIPIDDIREEVTKFLAAQPVISGDPWVRANVGAITFRAAQSRARRRLATAIKAGITGGAISPYHIAGPAGYAVRIAESAANREHEVGNVFKKIGKGAKAVGKAVVKAPVKVVKVAAKGTAAVAKGTAKGATKVAKVTLKGGKAVLTNPLTLAAASFIPGGAQVATAVNLLKGNKPTGGTVTETTQLPLSDVEYIPPSPSSPGQSASGPQSSGGSGAAVGLGIAGAAALAFLFLKK